MSWPLVLHLVLYVFIPAVIGWLIANWLWYRRADPA
jgi:hypothetical protein